MRDFLIQASPQKLVTSFVFRHMDYCNSVFVNLPNDTITKLECIQNHAARLALKKAKRDHVTPLFRKRHWPPLQARINYTICVLCFKCINKTAPSYLSDFLEQCVPSRLLRPRSQNLLKIPPRAHKNALKRHSRSVPHLFGIPYHLISQKPRVKINLKRTLRPTFLSPIFVFEFLSHWYIVCMRSVCVCIW